MSMLDSALLVAVAVLAAATLGLLVAGRRPIRSRALAWAAWISIVLLGVTVLPLTRDERARPLSGRPFFPLWGIVYHRGRRSGRLLGTPVALRATPDGFIIALPFVGAQWFRNVLAAGCCVVRWKGVDYTTDEPRIVDWATGRPAFNPIQQAILDSTGIDRCLRLRRVG